MLHLLTVTLMCGVGIAWCTVDAPSFLLWTRISCLLISVKTPDNWVSWRLCSVIHWEWEPSQWPEIGLDPTSSFKPCWKIWMSRASFWSRDQIHVCCIAGGFFTTEPTGKSIWDTLNTQIQIHGDRKQNDTPFFSYPQSFPVTGSFPITGSFPMSWLFASGGQSNRRPQSF